MTTRKQPTEAWKKADKYRDAYVGERKNLIKVLAKDFSSVAYLYHTENNRPVAMIFKGRACKTYSHYTYNDDAKRAERVTEIMSRFANVEKRSRPARDLAVDDILRASWGYDQTNIDYYKVIKLIGKTMVEIIEIGQDREYNGIDHGNCVPDINSVIGEPMRRVARGVSVTIDQVRHASKVEFKEIAGIRLYESSSWSSWH